MLNLCNRHKVEVLRLVVIEMASDCNEKCKFCPNNTLSRGKIHVAQNLFKSIVAPCRQFALEAIKPFLQEEAMSNPNIMPRLKLVQCRLPKTKLRLNSNGYARTPERIDQLAELGLDRTLHQCEHARY